MFGMHLLLIISGLCKNYEILIKSDHALIQDMSILYCHGDKVFIDHNNYISKIYHDVTETLSDVETGAYQLNKKIFHIFVDNKPAKRKRKLGSDELQEECSRVKAMYVQFLSDFPNSLKSDICSRSGLSNTSSDVRELAQRLFETTLFEHKGIDGGNNSQSPLKCDIKGETFLVPPMSRFFSGCVKEKCSKLDGTKFDLVIADPPWWNKYIRRLKNANDKLSYSMMYNEDIASVPVKNLLATNSLVAVWCTNAPSHIAAVKDLIFPKWGVEYLTTWYWLKVATDLKPICEFSTGCKKQPYERIMLGKVGDVTVPESQLIVSVPSALHSHKPPLIELLSQHVKSSTPQTLELFARYLLPNTTSIGYEPLKWQHISLYEKIS